VAHQAPAGVGGLDDGVQEAALRRLARDLSRELLQRMSVAARF